MLFISNSVVRRAKRLLSCLMEDHTTGLISPSSLSLRLSLICYSRCRMAGNASKPLSVGRTLPLSKMKTVVAPLPLVLTLLPVVPFVVNVAFPLAAFILSVTPLMVFLQLTGLPTRPHRVASRRLHGFPLLLSLLSLPVVPLKSAIMVGD